MSVFGWHASEFQKSRTILYGRRCNMWFVFEIYTYLNVTCSKIQIDNKSNYV